MGGTLGRPPGQLVFHFSFIRKRELAEFILLTELTPDLELFKKGQLKHGFLMTGVVEKQLKQSKQQYFQHTEKLWQLLAQQAKTATA